MEDRDIIRTAAIGFIAITLGPVIIGGAIAVVSSVGVGVVNGVNQARYKHKIKKGLKNGSIIESNGHYFEVEIVEEA